MKNAAIVLVKPSVYAGGVRPGKWSIELGYRSSASDQRL